MNERTKKILFALIPGELCAVLAIFMFLRANENNDTTSIYIALGAMLVGSLISALNLMNVFKKP